MFHPKRHREMVERVRQFDSAAAEYLETDARNLSSFTESEHLYGCMRWAETLQGAAFWKVLSDKVDNLAGDS